MIQDNIKDSQKASSTANDTYSIKQQMSDIEVAQMKEKYDKAFIKGNDIIPYADREAVFKGKVEDIQKMAVTDNGEVVIPVIIKATEESPYLSYGYSVDVEIHR